MESRFAPALNLLSNDHYEEYWTTGVGACDSTRVEEGVGRMRRVALGDVCAWPARTTQRDGTLLIPYYNGPSHGRVSGDGDCGASVDGGKTWSKRATATPHEPGSATNRMNVAFGMLPNGEATLAACGWSLKQDAVSPSGFEIDQILSMWVCRSSDQGKSWRSWAE